MSPILFALSVVLVIFSVVVVHESGHFILAKLSGIRVDEFSVGFGPKLFAKRRGETKYSVRLLPLGGYVRMAGMLGLEGEADAGERNFYRAKMSRRLATIAAGIVFNFIFAIICFTVVNAAQPATPWSILPDSPAAAAGIPSSATIVQIDGRPIRDDTLQDVTADLHAATSASQGRSMQVTYQDAQGNSRTTVVTPELTLINPVRGSGANALPVGQFVITAIDGHRLGTGTPSQLLGNGGSVSVSGYVVKLDGSRGAAFTNATVARVQDGFSGPANEPGASWLLGVRPGVPAQSLPAAFVNGVTTVPAFISGTAVGIYDLITQPQLGGVNGPQGLQGPVGIAHETAAAAQNGFLAPNGLLWWIGFISLNLGIVNVLPIPFLDGGKLLFLLIEAVRRKRLSPQVEATVSVVGLALMVLLLVYVTIGDVGRLSGQ